MADRIQNSGGRAESKPDIKAISKPTSRAESKPCFNQNHRKQSNSISF